MKYILGISCYYHDSAACLIQNGEIVFAIQEERLTRIKHDAAFPKMSIKEILNKFDISFNDIEAVVFYEKPFLKFERLLETYIAFAPWGAKSFYKSMPLWIKEKLFQKQQIFNELRKIDSNFSKNKIKFSEHHLSHAASAFFPSPFKEAMILTLDGVGEWSTTTISRGSENKIEILEEINFPHSLGLLYSAFTYFLGFTVNSGEYKLMGLAPYGEPKYKNLILENLIDVKDDGSFKMNMDYFDYATGLTMTNKKFEKLFNLKVRKKDSELKQIHMDLAASVQVVIEEIILKICNYIKTNYQCENLCLAGGVALNCVANGKIIKNNIFKKVWIQPASGDAGCAIGSALAYWYIEKKNLRITSEKFDGMKNAMLGPSYSEEEIEKKLISLSAKFIKKTYDETINFTSESIIQGKAIGWFQGRMEFGPRALGNRSIIADPRNESMQKNLNLKIKYRESFRPFAPALLRENINDFFELDVDSPYMLVVSQIKKEKKISLNNYSKVSGLEKLNYKRSEIPAITHVDYSARLQTVDQNSNQKFYDLIKSFYKKTGVAVLINTSFNVRGEPIVCTVEDAYKCFLKTNLDILVIENFILLKNEQIK